MSELTKLRGFLEVNGEGLPTPEQWVRIVRLIKGEEPVPHEVKPDWLDPLELLKRPTTWPDHLRGPGTPLWPSPNIWYSGEIDTANWKLGNDGNMTYTGSVEINNSLDVEDVSGIYDSLSVLDPKLLDMDGVVLKYNDSDTDAR